MQRVGLYPGSFDPIHNGHTDIIGRVVKLVDKLVLESPSGAAGFVSRRAAASPPHSSASFDFGLPEARIALRPGASPCGDARGSWSRRLHADLAVRDLRGFGLDILVLGNLEVFRRG